MGSFLTEDGIRLHYDEYGSGDRIILSAQVGFDPSGVQQRLAGMGWHVYCLPHCKLVIYSNCGHNIDTDITEEVAEETDRFLTQACRNGKWYAPVIS